MNKKKEKTSKTIKQKEPNIKILAHELQLPLSQI
jgi:hypothetical protein